MASEIERDAAKSARPSVSGTTTNIKTAGGTEAETTDVWSVKMLVAAVGWSTISTTRGLVAFFLENQDKVIDTFRQALKVYGNVTDVTIGSLIIHLDCGSQEKYSKFQQDFEDGKVKEALENELRKIGCDAKLEVTLMKEISNVAGTEMSKETVNSNPEVVSHGEEEAEKERDQEADNSDVEDGSPPKRRRPPSSSGSDPKRNKVTAEASDLGAKEPAVVGMTLAGSSGIEQPEDIITMDNRGNLSTRQPPELRETLKVLEMKDLPPKTTPRKDIEEKFLPVDFLLLTAKECEHLSCLSFLDDIKMGDDDKLGPVYFGFNSSKSKIAVIKCAMGAAGPGGSIVVVQDAVPILRPKAVICVGYCASLDEKKAKLGDVIVSAKLITYALTKARKNKIEHRGYVVPPNTKMAKRIPVVGAGWVAPLKNPEDLKVTVRNDGVLLSGPTVLAKSELRRELKNQFLQGTAIEMEGEGLYAAAHNHGIEWLVIKGVSDFGDDNKSGNDSWRPFASVMAASLVAHMLNDSIAFANWCHYGDNSDVEDGSLRKRRRSSSSPSSDPKRNKGTAGESYAEAAQPGPSNQGEPRSIRPVDKAPTTYKVKNGTPSDKELYAISKNIAEGWKPLGRNLNIAEAELVKFHKNHEEYTEKPYQMLLYWKRREGEKQPTKATYLVLHDALCHPFVARKDLAEKICCQLQN